MKKLFAVILGSNAPEEFRACLRGYLHEKEGFSFVFCSEFVFSGCFLECDLLMNKTDTNPWRLHIHPGFVLTIADMSKDNPAVGFLS